jgi:hypothetical protein
MVASSPRQRALHDQICQFDHLGGVGRLDEVRGVKIAVAEMEAKLYVLRNGRGQPPEHAGEDLLHARERWRALPAAVPLHHFDADIPLQRQVLVRDGRCDSGNLAEHGLLVCGQYPLGVGLDAERVDDRVRGRQAYLEAHLGRKDASAAGGQEILIGSPGLPGVAELTEVEIFGSHPVSQLQGHQPQRIGRPGHLQVRPLGLAPNLGTSIVEEAGRGHRHGGGRGYPRNVTGTWPGDAARVRRRTSATTAATMALAEPPSTETRLLMSSPSIRRTESSGVQGGSQHRAVPAAKPKSRTLMGVRGHSDVLRHHTVSGWPDSNRRPPRPKRGALAKLRYSPCTRESSLPGRHIARHGQQTLQL